KIEIPEKEIEDFYNAHQSEMRGKSYSEVKEEIRSYLKEQKQGEVITQYIDNLKEKVKVIRNEEWIKEQRRLKPPNPLDKALKSGKPTVLDLGAGYCVPCKMMKPIFEELEREYEGKANIILLEISEYRDLANRYRVRVIPTQIFFDKNGNQYWRHEGFLPKEEIVKKLKELGVE
ncbi:MAG: thioredoxin domain-containing protein, partial [candidate division WOR-3 bacterium]